MEHHKEVLPRPEDRFLVTISKRWSFDAAHKIPNHNGKCGRLHGHTYTVTIGLRGYPKQLDGSSDEGMVLDYYHLSEYWKTELEPLLDHQYLNETLPIPITTAEYISDYLLKRVIAKFGNLASFVTVQETPNTAATVHTDNYG